VTTSELADLLRGIEFICRALASPVDKDAMARDLSDLRRIFGKSIVAGRDMPAGHLLTASDLAFKKPGAGLAPEKLDVLLSRRLRRRIAADQILSEDDVEDYTTQSRGSAG
jgi:sialic acid synthase SpsE